MTPRVSLRKSLGDPALLGNILAGDSWFAWRALLIALMGERLTHDERELFAKLTGRQSEPLQRVEEFVGVIGRRGGKSRAISVIVAYIAGLCEHSSLVAGEHGIVLVIAPDQRQADIVLDYVEAAFRNSPILCQLIEQRTQRSLRLTNGIDIEVRASDFRRLRGPTYIAIIADEVAFWPTDNSTNPDNEILNAVRPGLATTGGPLFLISSPYARRGELWRTYNKHFGPNGDPLILVAKGATLTFNPTLPQSVVDRAMERDRASAEAEYGAEFRRDVESFVTIEVVQACVSRDIFERAALSDVRYAAFCDPSGGSADSFTLAIGHKDSDGQTIVLDALREVRPPFSPAVVVGEFAQLLKTYGISRIVGDRYAGQWPVEQFAKAGIHYEQSAKPKSELYVDLLPLINSTRIDLLDNQRLINQLCGLERRTARGGRDSIEHGPGGHDDLANAIAGLASQLNKPMSHWGLFEHVRREGEKAIREAGQITIVGRDRQTPVGSPPVGGPNFGFTFSGMAQPTEGGVRLRVPSNHQGAFLSRDQQRVYHYGKDRIITVAPENVEEDVPYLIHHHGCTRV